MPGDLLYLLYREGCVERVAGREHGVAGSLARFADGYHLGHTAELSEVLDDPFIQYAHGSGLRHVVNDMFAQIDATPKVAYEIQEDQVIAGLVAQGFGVSVVPYMEMLLRLNVKILQISRPVPNRMFYLVTDPAKTLSPAAADFKRFVLAQSEGR